MVREAVEQRGRHFGVAEDRGPFAEREVRGDDNRGLLVELCLKNTPGSCAIREPLSGTSNMPDSGGGRIVVEMVL